MSEMGIRFRQGAEDRVVSSLRSSLIVEAVLQKGGGADAESTAE